MTKKKKEKRKEGKIGTRKEKTGRHGARPFSAVHDTGNHRGHHQAH